MDKWKRSLVHAVENFSDGTKTRRRIAWNIPSKYIADLTSCGFCRDTKCNRVYCSSFYPHGGTPYRVTRLHPTQFAPWRSGGRLSRATCFQLCALGYAIRLSTSALTLPIVRRRQHSRLRQCRFRKGARRSVAGHSFDNARRIVGESILE